MTILQSLSSPGQPDMTIPDEETLIRVATFLRRSPLVKTQELIMAEKRVDVFKGAFATRALLSPEYAKLRNVPKVSNAGDATHLLQELQTAGLFLRARLAANQGRFLQPDLTRTWSDEALYAWVYEGSQLWYRIMGVILVICVLGVFMFPLWPVGLRSRASGLMNWAMYLVMGLIGFLIVLSIVRMVFYMVTYFLLKPGVWIFPNLWADCGVIESFKPVWAWDLPLTPPTSSKSDSAQRNQLLASFDRFLVRGIELSRVPITAFSNDIYRLFSHPSDNGILRALRKFTSEFEFTDTWLITFSTTDYARIALKQLAGACISLRPLEAWLVPLSVLDDYRHVNGLVENLESCIMVDDYPPSTTADQIAEYFSGPKLRTKLLESPIIMSPNKRTALVEFESKEEAHRAYRRFLGAKTISPTSEIYSPHLYLVQ